jgi:RimJ/RimL family protein N-acetyltransferase
MREMTQDDYSALVAILRDEQTMYAYNGAFTHAETQEWLDKQLFRYKNDGFGLLAVILKQSGQMIGQAGLSWQDIPNKRVIEIGYLFNRAYWGNGYATEAAAACKEYAFRECGFDEVFSIIRDINVPSMNVAIRNGMLVRERCVRRYKDVDMPHYVFHTISTSKQ